MVSAGSRARRVAPARKGFRITLGRALIKAGVRMWGGVPTPPHSGWPYRNRWKGPWG